VAPVLHPVLELVGYFTQVPSGHPLAVAVCVKGAQDAFLLLKRLNGPVQKQAIKTPIPKSDAILVMLVEGVHRTSSVVRYLEAYRMRAFSGITVLPRLYWDIKACVRK
jgi:hypothetical protein